MLVIQLSKNGKDAYVQTWATNGRMLHDTELLTTETGVWNNIHSAMSAYGTLPDTVLGVIDNRDIDNPYYYDVWIDEDDKFFKFWQAGWKKFPKYINRYS